MNNRKERFFDYAKALESAKYLGKKNQRELSEELDFTEVHLSKIANEKSVTTLAKTLKLLNDFDLCIDDYVDESYRVKQLVNYEDRKIFGNCSDDEIILIIDFLKKAQQLKQKSWELHTPDNKIIAKRVGSCIRKLRQEKNISETVMAKELAMQPESYRNIESGIGTVMDNYVVIAKVLEVPVGVLFADFIRNKKSIMHYEMGQLFSALDVAEKKEVREFMDIVLALHAKDNWM